MTPEQKRTLAWFREQYEKWRWRELNTQMSTADWFRYDRARAEYFACKHFYDAQAKPKTEAA